MRLKRGDRIRHHFSDPPDLDRWDCGIVIGAAYGGEKLMQLDVIMEDSVHFGAFYHMTLFHDDIEVLEPMSYEELCTHPDPIIRDIAHEQRGAYESGQSVSHP